MAKRFRKAVMTSPPNWQKPTGDEVRAMVQEISARLGRQFQGGDVANLLGMDVATPDGVSGGGSRTFRDWVAAGPDTCKIPFPNWALLAYTAGYGIIFNSLPKAEDEIITAERVGIRPETLTPASIWVRPTGDELRRLVDHIGDRLGKRLTSTEVATLVGHEVTHPRGSGGGSRTIRRWYGAGADPSIIPYSAWALLAHVAGLGVIWTDSNNA